MSITAAEQERLLRKALRTALEQQGYFCKFSQTGGVTILKGTPGGQQEVVASDMSVLECGRAFGIWGEDNNRETHEQLMNPTTSPDGTGRPTPFAVATIEKNRKDSRDKQKTMNDKPTSPARQRAADLIFDFKTRSGAFNSLNKPRGGPARGG